MEFIRSWREFSFVDFLRSASGIVREWRITHFLVWCISILMVGLLTGAMAVLFPPIASIGFVALVGVILLWAMPDLHAVPDNLLRKMFFVMVFVQLCVPNYYAIDLGYLPWISLRRLFAVIVIILFSITVAASKSARSEILESIRRERLLAFFAFGFLAMIFISILTSRYPSTSIKEVADAFLSWYVPLFACILIIRDEEDIILLLRIIAVALIVDTCAGLVEFALQRRYYFDIFPKSVLDSMMASNPVIEMMFNMSMFRNGLYRAASIYTVSLSFGELAAMVAPIGAYFILHGRNGVDRAFGLLTIVACLTALFIAGARGAYLSFLVAAPIMAFIWSVRYSRLNPQSLVGPIMLAIYAFGFVALIGLIFAWQRLRNMVFGGGETAASTESRVVQWELAKPHILSNPVTGHGAGTGADVIGYMSGNVPSVDSYVLSLLVEIGVPGLIFFFGMIICGIIVGLRQYLTNFDKWSALGGPIACSLIAFVVYRLALSQRENHTLFFLLVGLIFAIGKIAYERRKAQSDRLDSPVMNNCGQSGQSNRREVATFTHRGMLPLRLVL